MCFLLEQNLFDRLYVVVSIREDKIILLRETQGPGGIS